MGPTASGKSALAYELVKQFPCEIISVDSTLVYRGMDIGTAKPTPAELAVAPHRLIDIRDPAEPYSAADFCQDAKREIADIHARNKIPLLVGGTMLYFRALQQGLAAMPAADERIRQMLVDKASKHGWDALYQELRIVDPVAAARIHPNDPQRLQRALEVYYVTGKPMTDHFNEINSSSEYAFLNLGLLPENRKWLHDRIALRFDIMLKQGFIDEVKALYARSDLSADLPALRAVGYRQAWAYLAQQISYDEMVEQGIAATRQLAKRQITWLRRWPQLYSFACDSEELLTNVTEFLKINLM